MVYASNEAGTMDLWHQEEDGRASQITSLPGERNRSRLGAPAKLRWRSPNNFGTDGISIVSPRGGQPTRDHAGGGAAALVARRRAAGLRLARRHLGGRRRSPAPEPELVVSDTAGIPYAVWSIDGAYIYYWNRSVADLSPRSCRRQRQRGPTDRADGTGHRRNLGIGGRQLPDRQHGALWGQQGFVEGHARR